MKKNDIILLCAVLAAALTVFILTAVIKTDGALSVRVNVGNDEVYTYPLDEDCIRTINTSEGYNILVIEGGSAYISEADCANQICVSSASISRCGESIVCLPHKVSVTIVSE